MPTRSIRVDIEAYDRLMRAKRDGESFSEIIKRSVAVPFDLDRWLRQVRRAGISEEAAKAVERHVAMRRRRPRLGP